MEITLSEEEILRIKIIIDEYAHLRNLLNFIDIESKELEERLHSIKIKREEFDRNRTSIKEKEESLMKDLISKYGQGKIKIEDITKWIQS